MFNGFVSHGFFFFLLLSIMSFFPFILDLLCSSLSGFTSRSLNISLRPFFSFPRPAPQDPWLSFPAHPTLSCVLFSLSVCSKEALYYKGQPKAHIFTTKRKGRWTNFIKQGKKKIYKSGHTQPMLVIFYRPLGPILAEENAKGWEVGSLRSCRQAWVMQLSSTAISQPLPKIWIPLQHSSFYLESSLPFVREPWHKLHVGISYPGSEGCCLQKKYFSTGVLSAWRTLCMWVQINSLGEGRWFRGPAASGVMQTNASNGITGHSRPVQGSCPWI